MKFLAAKGYRTIALDQRGFGFSSGSFTKKEDFQQKYLCDDLLALLNALSIEKCILIGHDWVS